MKKALKWIGIAVVTPIVLLVLLAALLYLPPVQNWAARKVTAMLSEQTGMEISLERISLEFPLNLGIEQLRVLHQNDSLPQVKDTIADIEKLVVDVRLWPLVHSRVVVDEISLHQARLNTNGFISDLRVKGDVGELWLQSHGTDLNQQTIEVNGARLRDAHLDINLTDTAAVDTTSSQLRWRINADSLSISRTQLDIHLPGDTSRIGVYFGRFVAREANVNLEDAIYKIGRVEWHDGSVAYADKSLNDLSLRLDSVHLDDKHVLLPNLRLHTPDSDVQAEADIDLNVADSLNPGKMHLRLNAQIGKQDLLRLSGELPQDFVRQYPNHPLELKGVVEGNLQHLNIAGLDASLPTAFQLRVNGTAGQLTDLSRLQADLNISFNTSYRIPSGISLNGTLKADGPHYAANLKATEGAGKLTLVGKATLPLDAQGSPRIEALSYDADIRLSNLNLRHFMPKDSLGLISADLKAKGYGTDLLHNRSHLEAEGTIHQLQYGHWNLSGITANAHLQDGHGQVSLTGHNQLFEGTIGIDALLDKKQIDGRLSADLQKADLYRLRLVDDTLSIGLSGNIDIKSDLQKTHYLSGRIGNITIQDEKNTYRPNDIGLLLRTNPDTTYVRAQSGDFIVKFDGSSGYEQLLKEATILTDSIMVQYEQNIIDQPAIKRLLPTAKLHVESKRDNPIANLLLTNDIDFKELLLDLNTSPLTGVNGSGHLYALNYDSTRIDTIKLQLVQKGERLTYNGQIRNNKRNPQFVFNALFDGHVHEHGALAGLRYYDAQGRMGVRIGATAEMEPGGLRFRLLPDRPTIGYKEFNLNKDNFLFLDRANKIQAKVDLIADDKTGMKLYTENQDSTMRQDLTLSLNQLNLGELTSVIPYVPHITGWLNGDYHILQDQQENISVASDMAVQQMTYEGSPIGNLSSEFVYLMREDDSHVIDARLMLDDEEFGTLSGSYKNEGEGLLDAVFTMNRLPLSLVNGFIPDQLMGLEGFAEGSLNIRGTTRHPAIDGEVYVDSAYLFSIPYGIRMRLDSDPVRIVDSKLLLENYGLYAYRPENRQKDSDDEPLNVMGSLDFSDTEKILVDMRLRARNFPLINARQEAKSIAFGKAFVNFFARLNGSLDQLRMRGRLDVLGSTDMTYMLLDSPLSTDNRLEELVKFTDFSDSTQVVVKRPAPSGLDMDLAINVSQGAHIVCDLNAEQTNYIDLTGGGELRMRYSDALSLTGRYTLSNGEMKYSLPVIPLKTFTIKDGSYVEFTGDPMNPRLNITATERTKATVGSEEGMSRSVAFDCGVVITKTLNDMGLAFIIDAPEDQTIAGELTTMSAEERGKIAVTMLTTGMYLADGNTGSFSMNNALSSFLQSEINNISGSALKTLDLQLGIDNATDATGATHTDYSFKFAKRFMNNRLKIELGGKVSTGNDMSGQKQSFFDNVTMEYRLNQDATQNLKLFYSQNVYDWLEGYTSKYGGGFIWRRQVDNFWDLFKTKKP